MRSRSFGDLCYVQLLCIRVRKGLARVSAWSAVKLYEMCSLIIHGGIASMRIALLLRLIMRYPKHGISEATEYISTVTKMPGALHQIRQQS